MLTASQRSTNSDYLCGVVLSDIDSVDISLLEERDIDEFVKVRACILEAADYNEAERDEIYETKNAVILMIKQVLSCPSEFILIAKSNNIILGFVLSRCGLYRRTLHAAELEIGILPGYRGRGIGRLLARTSINIASKEGFLHKLNLVVMETNIAALKSFKSVGFIEEALIPCTYFIDGEFVGSYHLGLLLKDV